MKIAFFCVALLAIGFGLVAWGVHRDVAAVAAALHCH